jgi:hypothetical protein
LKIKIKDADTGKKAILVGALRTPEDKMFSLLKEMPERNWSFGVPYGNRTRVAAVKENRFTVIQRKPAAWIAP